MTRTFSSLGLWLAWAALSADRGDLRAQSVPERAVAQTSALSDALRSTIAAPTVSGMRHGDVSDVRASLRGLYEASGWQPLWLDSAGVPTPASRALLRRLRAVADHGLDPADYDAAVHDSVLARFDAGDAALDAVARAEFDARLSSDAVRYLAAMRYGRVRLKWVDDSMREGRSFITVRRAPLDVAELVASVRVAQDPTAALLGAEDRGPGYRRMQQALASARQVAHAAPPNPLPPFPERLAPGQHYAGAARLRQLLLRLGDLADTLPVPEAQGDTVYTEELAAGVRRLQQREGLAADGVIAAKTAARFARPYETPLRALTLALERRRSLPDPPRDSIYVQVNIPEFRMRVLDPVQDTTLLAMSVVVGGRGRNETPELASGIDMIVFSPTWRIPPRILREEIIPKVLADTNYLTKQGMELVRGGKVVPATFDNVAVIGDSVGVRQKSGGFNALGHVKFIFPNAYGVYMHDTPTRSTFRRAQRAESHGCIRLEDATALATWLLRDDSAWTSQRMKKAMKSPAPVDVDLPGNVPVRLVYETASLGPDGKIRFFGDVYGRDRYLEQALRTGYPYPTRPTPLQQRKPAVPKKN
jgi:murein L,D-transpeptidase YcbB/YkuD